MGFARLCSKKKRASRRRLRISSRRIPAIWPKRPARKWLTISPTPATETYDRELDYTLEENSEHVLEEIEAALRRIEEGTYGICTNCGKQIAEERLEHCPGRRCASTARATGSGGDRAAVVPAADIRVGSTTDGLNADLRRGGGGSAPAGRNG